jgi:hypothetical protein
MRKLLNKVLPAMVVAAGLSALYMWWSSRLTREFHFITVEDARRSEQAGAIPEFVPRGSTDLHLWWNLDQDAICLRFAPPSDVPVARWFARGVASRLPCSLDCGAPWWPAALRNRTAGTPPAGYQSASWQPECFVAVSQDGDAFWGSRPFCGYPTMKRLR